MLHARETTLTFFLMYLSPLKPKSCAGYNFHAVRDNVIFDRDISSQECRMQEGQLLLCYFF